MRSAWHQAAWGLGLLMLMGLIASCGRDNLGTEVGSIADPPTCEASVADVEAQSDHRQKLFRERYAPGTGRAFVSNYYIWTTHVMGLTGGPGRLRSSIRAGLIRSLLEASRRHETFGGSLPLEQLEMTALEWMLFDRLRDDFHHDSWPEVQDHGGDAVLDLRAAVAQWVDHQVQTLSVEEQRAWGRRGALGLVLNYMIGRWTDIDESSAHLDAIMRFGNYLGVQFISGHTVEAWRLDVDGLRQLADLEVYSQVRRSLHQAFWEFWIAVMAEKSLDASADGWHDWCGPRWDAWAERLTRLVEQHPDGPVAQRADECVQILRRVLGR